MAKGVGRPLTIKPGPNISSKSQMDIPNEVIVKILRDALDDTAYDTFAKLPEESRRIFITQVKQALFKVTDRASADPTLLYFGEYGDMRGVGVEFDFEQFYKDPYQYLKGLPKQWVSGIFNQADIDREIELQVVREAIGRGKKIKDAFPLADKLGDIQLLGGNNWDSDNDREVDETKGRDNIKKYKEYSNGVIDWVGKVQVLPLRDAAVDSVVDKTHYIIAEELAYGDRNGDMWEKKLDPNGGVLLDANGDPAKYKEDGADFAQLLESRLNSADPRVRSLYLDYQNDGYRRAMTKTLQGSRGVRVGNLQTFMRAGYQGQDPRNAYTAGKMLDGFLGGKLDDKNKVYAAFIDEIRQNPQQWGFSSQAVVEALQKHFKGFGVNDFFGPKDSKTVLGSAQGETFTREELYNFTQLFTSLRDQATSARSSIRSSLQSKYKYNSYQVAHAIAQQVGADDHFRARIESRLKGVIDWENYVQVRSMMESQDEFIAAVGKGRVWEKYFYLGKYNNYTSPYIQQMHSKIMNMRIPGTNVRLIEAQQTMINKRNAALQFLGFAGNTSDKRGLLNNLPLMGKNNVMFLYESDFDLRYWAESGQAVEFASTGVSKKFTNLFSYNQEQVAAGMSTFENLEAINREFKSNFLNPKAPYITLFARDLEGIKDVHDIVERMVLHPAYTRGSIDQFRDIFKGANLGSPEEIKNYLIGLGIFTGDEPGLNRQSASLFKIFRVLEKYQEKGLSEHQFFDFIVMLKNGKFKDIYDAGSGTLKLYAPLLKAVATRLSNAQTFIYQSLFTKVEPFFKAIRLDKPARWLWQRVYNPRYGAYNQAQHIVRLLEKSALGKFWGKLAGSALGKALGALWQKVGFSAFTGVGAFTAYLASAIAKLTAASLRALKKLFFKGDLKAALYEFKNWAEDVIVKPINAIARLVVFTFVIIMALLFFVVNSVRNDAFSQYRVNYATDLPYNELIEWEYDEFGNQCFPALEGNTVGQDFKDEFIQIDLFNQNVTSCPTWRTYRGEDGRILHNFHKGVDFGYPVGTDIPSPISGAVVETIITAESDTTGYGNLVVLRKDVGGVPYYMYFAHLDSINVRVGQTVDYDDSIGGIGNTGNSTGPHLHFEVRVGSREIGAAENPCSVIECPDYCTSDPFEGAICDSN